MKKLALILVAFLTLATGYKAQAIEDEAIRQEAEILKIVNEKIGL